VYSLKFDVRCNYGIPHSVELEQCKLIISLHAQAYSRPQHVCVHTCGDESLLSNSRDMCRGSPVKDAGC
jgi:hypothetical protein